MPSAFSTLACGDHRFLPVSSRIFPSVRNIEHLLLYGHTVLFAHRLQTTFADRPLIRLDSMDTLDLRIWSVNGLFPVLQKPRYERRPSGFGL